MAYSYMYYCPKCGKTMFEEDIYCNYCKCKIQPAKSIKDRNYFLRKAESDYNDWRKDRDILFEEEIQHTPQFDRAAYEARIQAKQKRDSEKRFDSMVKAMTEEKNKNLPKCPTCSSVNIRKIGTLERGLSVSLWELGSGKIGKSMVCKDCGYKW